MSSKEFFPAEDVERSVADRDLQRCHSLEARDPKQRAGHDSVRRKAIEQGASERAQWIYFRSPEWTWEQECGREGWILYDRETQTQYAFLMTAMN